MERKAIWYHRKGITVFIKYVKKGLMMNIILF